MSSDAPILVVEDNPDDELLILRALKKNMIGNRVIVVRDGQEALDWVRGEGAHASRDMSVVPHLILLDLKLPKISGLEVLESIRADPRTRRYPVVILTSSDEECDIVQGYDRGANSYIHKPVDFDEFVDAVKNLGLYWLVLNRAPAFSSEAVRTEVEIHAAV